MNVLWQFCNLKKNQFLQLTNQILTEGNAQTMLLFNSTITVKNRHDTYKHLQFKWIFKVSDSFVDRCVAQIDTAGSSECNG